MATIKCEWAPIMFLHALTDKLCRLGKETL